MRARHESDGGGKQESRPAMEQYSCPLYRSQIQVRALSNRFSKDRNHGIRSKFAGTIKQTFTVVVVIIFLNRQ